MTRPVIIGMIVITSLIVAAAVIVGVVGPPSSTAPQHSPQSLHEPAPTNESREAEIEGQKVLERERTRKPTAPIRGVFQADEPTTQLK